MAKYLYEARNRSGKIITGTLSAANEDELYQKLKEEDKYLISAEDALDKKTRKNLPALLLSEFNRELSDMLGAGITLVRALTILSQEETLKKKEKEIYVQLLKLVRQGESVSDAMEQIGGAFPLLMIHMYKAAEMNGSLAETARRLSIHYEKEHQLNTKIKGATTYPQILCILAVLLIIFIMSMIVPRLSDLFDTLDTLPAPTRILFGVSNFIGDHLVILLIIFAILGIVLAALLQMPVVRMWMDEKKLELPIIGKLLSIIYTARFARALSSLYSAGIPIVSAIQIVRKTIGNSYIEKQFDQVTSLLREGKPLSESVDSVDGFRNKLSSVIRVGEESGDLVRMLDSLADSFDYESEMATARLISFLEPTLIVVMAVIIGFVMVSVMLPIYESYSAIGSNVYY